MRTLIRKYGTVGRPGELVIEKASLTEAPEAGDRVDPTHVLGGRLRGRSLSRDELTSRGIRPGSTLLSIGNPIGRALQHLLVE